MVVVMVRCTLIWSPLSAVAVAAVFGLITVTNENCITNSPVLFERFVIRTITKWWNERTAELKKNGEWESALNDINTNNK